MRVVRVYYTRLGISQRGIMELDKKLVRSIGRSPVSTTFDHKTRSLYFRVEPEASETLVKRVRWMGYWADVVPHELIKFRSGDLVGLSL